MIRGTRQLTIVTSAHWVSNTVPKIIKALEEIEQTEDTKEIIWVLKKWQTASVSPCSSGKYGNNIIDKVIISKSGYGGVIRTDSGFYPLINYKESTECWVKFR